MKNKILSDRPKVFLNGKPFKVIKKRTRTIKDTITTFVPIIGVCVKCKKPGEKPFGQKENVCSYCTPF